MTYFTSHTQEIATTKPRCDRSPLTQRDSITIARVLTWDMCAQVQAHEVITIAVNNGIVQVKLIGGRTALLSVDTFKLILEQQRQQLDEDVAHIEQLEQKLEKDSKKIKLARVGKIYPLERGIQLLGTFYPVNRDGRAQVVNGKILSGFMTTINAQNPFAQLSASDENQEVAA